MGDSDCPTLAGGGELPSADTTPLGDSSRLRSLVHAHYDFVWRTLRYLGIHSNDAEDGAQQVMCVLARRIREVTPGLERRFLFATAGNVAATYRRTLRRRRETVEEDVDALVGQFPGGDVLLDERRAHETLQRVLQAIPVELRLVFVLYEVEELTMAEIAATIGVPLGTVASRLRRGRESFRTIVRRMQAADGAHRGTP